VLVDQRRYTEHRAAAPSPCLPAGRFFKGEDRGGVKRGATEMTIHYNWHSRKKLRRKLRRESTPAEKLLWKNLRNRKLSGFKFRRQYSIDYFVMDFYCPEKKIGVELEGNIHDDPDVKNRDENREGFIKSFGIKLLRIKNEEVLNNMHDVLRKIEYELIHQT
jgi:very-short-patch-repair endonuclease